MCTRQEPKLIFRVGEATRALFFSLVPSSHPPPSSCHLPTPRPNVYFDFLLGTFGHLKRNRWKLLIGSLLKIRRCGRRLVATRFKQSRVRGAPGITGVNIRTYACTPAHIYIHTHIYVCNIYIYIYIYIYTRVARVQRASRSVERAPAACPSNYGKLIGDWWLGAMRT